MDRLVYYHHPCAENFSLRFSSDSLEDLRDHRKGIDGKTKVICYPFEDPVYVLYEGSETIETANDVEFESDWLEERLRNQSRATAVVTFRLIELLQAAAEVRKDNEFRLYKDFEPDQIHRALENVSWGAALPVVAGELMSNLVLRHALPNANHRTSIAMLQFSIDSVDSTFEMPSTHVDDHTWKEWVDPYIVESKRLITVRRNNVRFQHLKELGVDIAARKGGIRIRLADYDLDMHWREALTEYAERHEDHCVTFAEEVLRRTGRSDLLKRTGPTKAEFVDFLERDVANRDLTDLF